MSREALVTLEPGTPWLACVKRRADRLDIFITDLRRFFSCSCEHDDIQQQLKNADIASPVGTMLGMFMENLCGLTSPERQAKFELRRHPPDQHSADFRLEWWVKGAACFTFRCHAASDPAACIRDEVVLPLLRTTGQLRQLLPEEVVWAPPAGPLPLPKMCDPLVSRILTHKWDPDSPPPLALDTRAAEDVADGAEAAPNPSAPAAEPPPPEANSRTSGAAAEASELSEAEQQRLKRVQEKQEARERKANKTARN